jgi:hypothetical protein
LRLSSVWLGPVACACRRRQSVRAVCARLDAGCPSQRVRAGRSSRIRTCARWTSVYRQLPKRRPARIRLFRSNSRCSFRTATQYSQVLATWQGVSGGERRPDISVQFRHESLDHVLLVEVKRSDDDRYRRDSIYKVFGYLYDLIVCGCLTDFPEWLLLFQNRSSFEIRLRRTCPFVSSRARSESSLLMSLTKSWPGQPRS